MSINFTEPEPGIGVLQVHRPQVRNALDWDNMQAFANAVGAAYEQKNLRALIITGSARAFIAGGDLKALAPYATQADGLRLSRLMTIALSQLAALPFPTIAALNGPARGGGAEIALACDLRVMAADADIGLVQVNLGLTPGWGAGQRLLHMVGYSRAFEWLATGRVLSAAEALEYGLANRLAPESGALPAALEFARQLASQPPETIRAIKRLLRAGQLLPAGMANAFEQEQFPGLWAAEAHLEAVQAFLERK